MENSIEALTPEYQQAISLHRTIMANGQLAADAFVEFCKGLKQMRDSKLYLQFGYEDFEAYTVKAVGLKQRQAYNYISTYEKLGTQFLQSNANLGVTKLELLASVPALDRDEAAAESIGMSVSEVKELVAKYNAAQEQLSFLQNESGAELAMAEAQETADTEREARKRAERERKELLQEVQELKAELAKAADGDSKVAALQAEIEALKEALDEPVEASEEAVEKIRAEEAKRAERDAKEKIAAIKKEAEEKVKSAKQKAAEELQKKIEDAEQKAKQEVANAEKRAQEIARQQVEDGLKDIEEEKATALARAAALEKQLKIAINPETVRLDFHLSAMQDSFAKVTDCLTQMVNVDPEGAKKFRSAVTRLLGKLQDDLITL